MSINDKEYQEISESIIHELRESNSDVYNVLNKINQYHEEKVLKTIRIMVDNNIIIQDSEGNLKL
jgi:uncharacterized iron-regulated protein